MIENIPALIDSLKVAMLGTTDGGLLDPDDSGIPVGEMFRLAAEWVEANAAGFRRPSPLTREAPTSGVYIHGPLGEALRPALPEPAEVEYETCPVCNGTAGYWAEEWRRCCYCKGDGRVPVEKGADE